MVFSKKILTLVLIVVVVGALAYFLVINKGSGKTDSTESSESTEAAEKPQETPLPVRVATAEIADLIMKLKSPGEAFTNRKIIVKSEVGGVIENLNIRESQHVRRGAPLLGIQDEKYALEVEKLEANRLKVLSELLLEKRFDESEGSPDSTAQAESAALLADFDKARTRFQNGDISREDFEKASRDYEYAMIQSGAKKDEIMAATKMLTQTEIDLKKSRMELEKTKIKAPFSGIITDIKVSPGEHITTGQELFTLVNIDQIQVHAKVLESEVGKMQVGREVDLRFSAYPDKVFKGSVKAISPLINPEDKTCNVIIAVNNPQEELKPGMHAEVEIAAEIYKDRLLVPQDAVISRSGRRLVFVVIEGVAKWRYVDVGLENEDYAEILDGVQAGEQVLIEGHFTLAHDAKVRIVQ